MDGEQETRVASSGFGVFEKVKRLVVVGAHADDMETLAGGTIAMLVERGVEVYEVICTQGDIGTHDPQYTRETLAETRRQEAQEGGRVLGLREVVTLDHHDGELEPTLALRAELAHLYRRWQPDTLLTFDPSWAGQVHPDHRAAGRAALDAFMPSKMELYHPEQLQEGVQVANIQQAFLFSPANPTIFVDVTTLYEKKIAATVAHKSQFPEGDKNLDWMRQLDSAAAERAGIGALYAEQFDAINVW